MKIFSKVLILLIVSLLGVHGPISAKTEWIRPEPGAKAPVWGFESGLRIGLYPESMRGLIHIYSPYLDRKEMDVMNYVAIEPIVKGAYVRGFSELEKSSLDGVRGKRIWTADHIDEKSLEPSFNVAKGVVADENGIETLSVFFIVEPYDCGAKVYVKAKFFEDKPYEVEFSTFTYGDSAELDNCIVTATMGNHARLRTLWLNEGTLHSGAVWPDYDADAFAPHEYISKDRMVRDANGYPYFIASPDEKNPAKAKYTKGTPVWWRYYGRKATQYWYCKTPAEDLNGIVNGRVVYWGDLLPIPGGISYENLEMKQSYHAGDAFVFGITPVEPERFIEQIKSETTSFRPEKSWGDVSSVVSRIEADHIGGIAPQIECVAMEDNALRVTVSYDVKNAVRQNDVKITVVPSFMPDFHWAPHLTPSDNHVADRHVFRNPAMIMQKADTTLTLIVSPENDFSSENSHIYMDLDALSSEMTVGMSKTAVTDHVLYEKCPGGVIPAGLLKFEFYLKADTDPAAAANPFRYIAGFFWENYGHDAFRSADFSSDLFDAYCGHTYKWAFDSWRDAVWQEFDVDGKRVGAPVFIVDISQSPNYGGQPSLREDCSIWNQAWFSSLRSASGLYRYARRTGVDSLMKKAELAKELALSAPKKDGLFYSVVATPTVSEIISGQTVRRSGGWENLYWGNSNRNPVTWSLKDAPFHILDMSWTAYIMLEWYEDLEKDERLLDYVTDYADKLVSLQFPQGFYPAWIDTGTMEVLPYLTDSPESSMSAWFLLKLYSITGKEKYKDSALRCLKAVSDGVIPAGRWEDFETYWSCCRYGSGWLQGRKVERNNMYKHCNFSMYWTAGALMEAYKLTSEKEYLDDGMRVMDEMLMMQSSWQPSFIYVDAVGGFGVLNSDGEWNDARASLFSELMLEYGKITGIEEYCERGMMALKSAFTMMYCPENPKTKAMWEKTWRFFGEEDYGFLMENYGHGGTTSESGDGMGSFTIYDWGNGAACEAYNRILDNWGILSFSREI